MRTPDETVPCGGTFACPVCGWDEPHGADLHEPDFMPHVRHPCRDGHRTIVECDAADAAGRATAPMQGTTLASRKRAFSSQKEADRGEA